MLALSAHHDAAVAKAALQVAISVRGGAVAGVIMHTSGQGGECIGELFRNACAAAGAAQLMGRTGALDNTVAEAFNSTLEIELSRRCCFTRSQVRRVVAA